MTLLSPSSSSHRRGVLPVVAAGVAALAVGLAGGWYFAGRDKTTVAAPRPTTTSTCTRHPTTSASGSSTARTTASPGKSPTAKPSASLVAYPSPRSITVNVYNATTRKGLAKATSLELAARGFAVGTVGNDPAKKIIAASAEIRYGRLGAIAAKVVAAQVVGAVLVPDNRKNASVDFVLGEGYAALTPTAQANAVISALASPTATGGC